jgi:WXXGXW repeat (2 copies)
MRTLGSIAAALVLSVGLLLTSRPTLALDVGVSVTIAPPELPVYEQPEIPGPGYLWTPGYWAWGDEGYYWVPGTWVLPPQEGYLWTPGYWVWEDGIYLWRPGYWSTEVGFYGGVNYGFGYFGRGYEGGYWEHGRFRYNRACNHIGSDNRITNVYNRTVINYVTVNHVSYNGGRGGIALRADEREAAVARTHHLDAVAAQRQQVEVARGSPELRVSANRGHP